MTPVKAATKTSKSSAVVAFLVYTTPTTKKKLDKIWRALGYTSRAEMARKVLNDFVANYEASKEAQIKEALATK